MLKESPNFYRPGPQAILIYTKVKTKDSKLSQNLTNTFVSPKIHDVNQLVDFEGLIYLMGEFPCSNRIGCILVFFERIGWDRLVESGK